MPISEDFKQELIWSLYQHHIASDLGIPADILAEQLISHLENLQYAIRIRDDFVGTKVPKTLSDPPLGSFEDELAKLRLEIQKLKLSIGPEVKSPAQKTERNLEFHSIAPGYINPNKESK